MGVAGEHARRRRWLALLISAAAHLAMASAADPAAFKAWIAQHGVSTAKVDMAKECGPGVRGMVAAADVAAGETLLDVPFALMMTLNTAQQGPLKKVIEEKQISPTMIMALHLLNEKLNPSSFYKDWISLLPEAFETPLFWGEEDLAGLQGSTILSVVQRRKETMQADYTALFDVLFAEYPELFKPEEYTFEAFRWALSTVWSRSFVFNIESQLVPVIVPFADMFEHANVESSFSLEDQEKVFRITLGKPLKAGERAYISLGAKPNSQLLMNYGFVLQDNLYDTVLINMFLNEDDPFYEAKSKILTVNNQPPSKLYYLQYEALPQDLLRALRIQLLKPSELDHYGKVFEGKRVSVENELDVLRQLVAACDTLLKQYPDTAVADQQLAQDAEKFAALSERAQTALVLRLGEKRVLHRTVELVSQVWSMLLVEGWRE